MPKRLRIALITERFGREFGGAESYAVNLIQIFSRDHDVTVIASEFEHELPIKEVHIPLIRGLPRWLRALFFAHQAQKKLGVLETFDVVHSHVMGPGGDVHVFHVVPVKFRRFFLQSRWRAWLSCLQPRNLAYLWLEAISVRSRPGHRAVAVSPSVESQLHRAYPKIGMTEMIPPGAHAVVGDSMLRIQKRAEFGWSSDDVVCLLVARNPLRKGFATIVQALEHLSVRFKLLVVGADRDVRSYLRHRHPGLVDRVTSIAPVDDVSPYYQCADIYVHPTLQDSFGMAPLEAMAHGLPVVLSASQYCGFAQFVHHKQDAWVLDDPKDAQSLADALFALDPRRDLRDSLIEQSAQLVQIFSWEQIAQRYESLYRTVRSERLSNQSQPRTQ